MTTGIFHGCIAILLDFGGTLDSDGEHWLDRFYDLYEASGLDVPRAEIKRVFYAADERCCDDPQVDGMGLRPLMTYHVRCQFSLLGLTDTEPARGMVETFCTKTERILLRNRRILARLRGRYRLGVVSNFYGNAAMLCQEAGLSAHLDLVLDSVPLGVGKPDPAIFRTALNRLGLPPERVVFVGDSYERDMMPARGLGMKTVWLKGPRPRIPKNAEPVDAVISSLTQLEALL